MLGVGTKTLGARRVKTDDRNKLIKTNMAVHYHTSAVIQIQCPGRVQACKYTYLNKVPFKKGNLNVTLCTLPEKFKTSWKDHVNKLSYVYNCTRHATTG